MGSSTRKKAEKRKEFQKQKLRVGKQKPKASNVTDTSFKSKGIVLREQSLSVRAPRTLSQVTHHLSLLSSRSDTQRRDSLAFIASHLSGRSTSSPLPQPATTLLARLLPLTLDGSQLVRSHLLKALRGFRADELDGQSERVLLHARAGMTHMAPGIRETALDLLVWALSVIPYDLVSSAGGWTKTLQYFALLLGWPTNHGAGGPVLAPVKTIGSSKLVVKGLGVLTAYVEAGFETVRKAGASVVHRKDFPLADTTLHRLPRIGNTYVYLGLFRSFESEDNEVLQDRVERQTAFRRKLQHVFESHLAKAKKEGGDIGRAAGLFGTAITEGMADYDDTQ